MVRFKKLNNKEKSSRYFNVKARCGTAYQKDNPRYYGTYMCSLWLEDKKAFYKTQLSAMYSCRFLFIKAYACGYAFYSNSEADKKGIDD